MKAPRNLALLSVEERRQFLSSFDTAILDCDGVLWSITSQPIERAEEGVQALNAAKKDLFFLSNNATRSIEELTQKFENYNIKLDLEKQHITPAHAIVDYLKGINFNKSVFLIGSTQLANHLRANHYEVVTGPNHVEEGGYAKELMTVAPNVGAVVFDSDLDLNLIKIHKAEMQLLNPECLLLLGATEDEYDLGKVVLSGIGKFQKQLQDKFHRKPIILGKPGVELGQFIAHKFAGKKVLFVGDNLNTDIEFANKLGFQSLLVFTGCTKKETMESHDKPEELPDYYLESMAQLGEVLKDL